MKKKLTDICWLQNHHPVLCSSLELTMYSGREKRKIVRRLWFYRKEITEYHIFASWHPIFLRWHPLFFLKSKIWFIKKKLCARSTKINPLHQKKTKYTSKKHQLWSLKDTTDNMPLIVLMHRTFSKTDSSIWWWTSGEKTDEEGLQAQNG